MRIRRLFTLPASFAALAVIASIPDFAPLGFAQQSAPAASTTEVAPGPPAPPAKLDTPPPTRPKVVLVLSGGGARGTEPGHNGDGREHRRCAARAGGGPCPLR
jgi:hypothetical protein